VGENQFLVDTDILIAYLNRRSYRSYLEIPLNRIYYSAVTKKELLSKPGLKTSERQARLRRIIPRLPKETLSSQPLLWFEEYLCPRRTCGIFAGFEGWCSCLWKSLNAEKPRCMLRAPQHERCECVNLIFLVQFSAACSVMMVEPCQSPYSRMLLAVARLGSPH
jgi:hypothetical protein